MSVASKTLQPAEKKHQEALRVAPESQHPVRDQPGLREGFFVPTEK